MSDADMIMPEVVKTYVAMGHWLDRYADSKGWQHAERSGLARGEETALRILQEHGPDGGR